MYRELSLDSVFTSNAASDLGYGGQSSLSQGADVNSANTEELFAANEAAYTEKKAESPIKATDERFVQLDTYV